MRSTFILLVLLPALLSAQTNSLESFQNLEQKNIQQERFELVWTSNTMGRAAVQYGLTKNLELGIQSSNVESNAQHQITLQNLQHTTFYYARPLLIVNQDTLLGPISYYSTQSNSTGTIRVMFNQGTDPLYSSGSSPYIDSGGANIENEIISMINQASSTIDIAVYNNTRSAIVTALTNAHNNGIRVRYIANDGTVTSNAALSPAPPFPVFYVNASDLMHNKFMIIDADSVNTSWVWTGSCNWTYTDMYTNYNNLIAIQDQALAQAYVLEFEEMWGSTGANYNTGSSLVSSLKTNNTPHTFNIGGKTVESYFSPSDDVSNEIESTIYSADYDIEFCLLAYTRNELGTAVRNQHNAGIFEHGLMENINDFGSEFNWLVSQGVNILADNHATDLHHKYVIIDAGNSSSDPQVLTGSHNWTTAAEDRNDENTLIVHDATIANLYLQEFSRRWCEVKNNTNCTLPFTLSTLPSIAVEKAFLVYPNPASNSVQVVLPRALEEASTLNVYTTTGQLLRSYTLDAGLLEQQIDVQMFDNGLYYLVVQEGDEIWRQAISILH